MALDVALVHPPAVYDFRRRPLFPGPIAYTVSESTDQFIIPPIGMLSIADGLDRSGYRVLVDNLGERMASDRGFDAEAHLRRTEARVYGVGLHWSVHSQGAIEVARLCKKLHPESLVVMGGLTATRFHSEIISKYGFVDAVIRGEAEDPFLQLMSNLDRHGGPEGCPNATYRSDGNGVKEEPMMRPRASIDEFEFTRLDLLEPKGSVYSANMPPHWSLPVCRGCVYNCATCGGSAYSYRTYLGRDKPAFRSPRKLAEDIQKLSDQGVRLVFLFQDPRMGGRKYQEELLAALRTEKQHLESLTMELFTPADEDYIRELSQLGVPVTLTISPESGAHKTRCAQGRNYTNESLFGTIDACLKHGVRLMVFFMSALAGETHGTAEETWRLWEKVYSAESPAEYPQGMVTHSFGPMILLDPGSLAFDFPEKHGYRLRSKNLEDYVDAMALPSWHQWISYETKDLDSGALAELVLESIEQSVNIREKHGTYSRLQAAQARRRIDANRWMIDQVDKASRAPSAEGRQAALENLRKTLDTYGA